MKSIIVRGLLVLAPLTIANYGTQLFTGHDWDTALERTIFQLIAIVCFAIGLLFSKKKA